VYETLICIFNIYNHGDVKRMSVSGGIVSPGSRTRRFDLDEELLRVLSSHTRLEILRNLRQRQMTLSDLARALEFCKSTIHEHLKRLLEAGLIYRITGRKWIYYRLSRKGDFMVGMMG
jgi:DNA-binding transcriptional ArsR family regulator